jgi:hypothetical protein
VLHACTVTVDQSVISGSSHIDDTSMALYACAMTCPQYLKPAWGPMIALAEDVLTEGTASSQTSIFLPRIAGSSSYQDPACVGFLLGMMDISRDFGDGRNRLYVIDLMCGNLNSTLNMDGQAVGCHP